MTRQNNKKEVEIIDSRHEFLKRVEPKYASLIKEINKLRAQRDYWEKKYKKLEEKRK